VMNARHLATELSSTYDALSAYAAWTWARVLALLRVLIGCKEWTTVDQDPRSPLTRGRTSRVKRVHFGNQSGGRTSGLVTTTWCARNREVDRTAGA
jgi:hypothetical protein